VKEQHNEHASHCFLPRPIRTTKPIDHMDLFHSSSGSDRLANAPPSRSFGTSHGTTSPTSPTHATSSTPSTFSQGTTSIALPASPEVFLANLQEQFNQSSAAGVLAATLTATQAARRLKDITTALHGDTDVLRIYLRLDALPLAWLDSLFHHFHAPNHSPFHEIHLCIRSLLRPVLQDLNDDPQLSRAISIMVQNWASINVTIKFSFYHLGATIESHDRLRNFHEKDLLTAMAALPEHGIALTDILGEESRAVALPEIQLKADVELDDEYL